MLCKGDEPVPGYRLVCQLGEGGAGIVWRATGPGETAVALKFLSLSAKNGVKEYKALQRVKEIRHANLVPIDALWMLDKRGNLVDEVVAAELEAIEPTKQGIAETMFTEQGQPTTLVMAMPLGDKNLLDRLHEFQKMGAEGIPTRELLDLLEDAARGIDYLNSKCHDLGNGIVAIQHRDIKPQNILVIGDSAAVCDFGLARDSSDQHVSTAMTGTPAYIAPECINGRRPSHATDQYSLAISYCELRTGHLPFDNTSYVGVMEAHNTGNLNLSGLTPEEREVILHATAIDPDDRYANTLEMIRELRRAVEGAAPVIYKTKSPTTQQSPPIDAQDLHKTTPAQASRNQAELSKLPLEQSPPRAKPPSQPNAAMLQTVMDPGRDVKRLRRASTCESAQESVPDTPRKNIDRRTEQHAASDQPSQPAAIPPQPPALEKKPIPAPAPAPTPTPAPTPVPKRKTAREPVARERWEATTPGLGDRPSQAKSLLLFVAGIAIVIGLIFLLF